MSITAKYKLKVTKYYSTFVAIILLSVMNNSYSSESMVFKLSTSNSTYKINESINLVTSVQNISNKNINMINDFSHEGWLITITITDLQGVNYYSSPRVKMEMLSGSLKTFDLKPAHIFGKKFLISNTNSAFSAGKAFPAGRYTVQAILSTFTLGSWNLGIPIGEWKANPIEIIIKSEDD